MPLIPNPDTSFALLIVSDGPAVPQAPGAPGTPVVMIRAQVAVDGPAR
jgi:hypothetical protein